MMHADVPLRSTSPDDILPSWSKWACSGDTAKTNCPDQPNLVGDADSYSTFRGPLLDVYIHVKLLAGGAKPSWNANRCIPLCASVLPN